MMTLRSLLSLSTFSRSLSTARLALLPLVTAALLSGCGDDKTGSTDQTPDEFVAQSGLTFLDCGAVTHGAPNPTACSDTKGTAVSCFEAHLKDCSAARLRQTFTSDEGAPTTDDYFILPGDTCQVEVFVDRRADSFSAPADQAITHSTSRASCFTVTQGTTCPAIQATCGAQ